MPVKKAFGLNYKTSLKSTGNAVSNMKFNKKYIDYYEDKRRIMKINILFFGATCTDESFVKKQEHVLGKLVGYV